MSGARLFAGVCPAFCPSMKARAMTDRNLMTSAVVVSLTSLMIPVGPHDLLAQTGSGGNWQEFALWPTTDDQETPDIYGNIVAWQQFVYEYGDYDVYVADMNDLADPLVFVIGDSNDQTNPVIYENIVAWQDYVVWEDSADWDIHAADISSQTDPQVFVVSNLAYNDEQKPAIHGNTVVWQDGYAGDINIYGADITDPNNPAEFLIAGFELDQQRPAIYRTTVVWQDNFFGDWDIFAADIWQRNKPAEFSVSLVEHDQENPAIWGHIVVWQARAMPRTGSDPPLAGFFGDWDIYAADISRPDSPVEFAITTNDSSQTNPDIAGSIVVWQDYRNNNWDIFGYNLTTRHEFQITDNPYDQTNPAISGNVVAWQDNRSGSWNIYAVVLDGPEVAQCQSELAGDVNGDCKIDFTDLAITASHWLECDLEPEEACWQ